MDSRNPVFSSNLTDGIAVATEAPMTVQGTLNKLLMLFGIMAISGGAVWYQYVLGYADKVSFLTMTGLIVGLVVGFIIAFKQNLAPVLTPVYAFAEGALLGGLSSYFNAMYPGILIQAVALTFLSVFSMAFLYKTGIIRVTERLRSTIITATVAVAIFYLIGLILSLGFHINLSLIYSSSPISIGFSFLMVGLASFNLLLDFDFVEQSASRFLPKQYEWYGAFGLLVTIVWLYIEILRLLSKLREK